MMNNLQLIGTMLKFNVDVPPNAYIFFKYIDEFLSMKARFIEDFLEKFNQLFIFQKRVKVEDRATKIQIIM